LTLTPALGRGQCRQIAAERTRSSSGRIGAIDPEHTLAQGTMNDSSAPMYEPAPREGVWGGVKGIASNELMRG
jgi:hypothetical protein